MSLVLKDDVAPGAVRLTLNDDATRNSLSTGMMAALQAALDTCDRDLSVASIIIASSGKVFSSGHNLKELTSHRSDVDLGADYFAAVFGQCAKLMTTVSHHRCAIIAEVDGLASAAGCQLVAACDLAYASPSAGFCTPGVNIGLFCSTPMVPLSRNITSKHAMEMLLLGKVHDAAFAERVGLVNAVIPQNELRGYVQDVAKHIAGKSAAAIRHGKRLYHEQSSLNLEEAYSLASAVMTRNMLDGAACEGLDAFISKRQPNWPALT
jgi:enoyl-CoA hydratase/carnithine racemase